MVSGVCMDGAIGVKYGRDAMTNVFTNNNFDILFAMKSTYGSANNSGEIYSNDIEITAAKINNINGFIIVERGECRKFPNAYAVHLICVNRGFKATLLMGAYLYTIKQSNDISQVGILELAYGHENIPGLCSYGKFGFIPNILLAGPNCFADRENLPMGVYLGNGTDSLFASFVPEYEGDYNAFLQKKQEFTKSDIINTIITNKSVNRITRFKRSDLCAKLMPNGGDEEQISIQHAIAELYNKNFNYKIPRSFMSTRSFTRDVGIGTSNITTQIESQQKNMGSIRGGRRRKRTLNKKRFHRKKTAKHNHTRKNKPHKRK